MFLLANLKVKKTVFVTKPFLIKYYFGREREKKSSELKPISWRTKKTFRFAGKSRKQKNIFFLKVSNVCKCFAFSNKNILTRYFQVTLINLQVTKKARSFSLHKKLDRLCNVIFKNRYFLIVCIFYKVLDGNT